MIKAIAVFFLTSGLYWHFFYETIYLIRLASLKKGFLFKIIIAIEVLMFILTFPTWFLLFFIFFVMFFLAEVVCPY